MEPTNIRGLVDSRNRSYHPINLPARDRAPSVAGSVSDVLACGDCHGNSDPTGAKGPHGSAVRYILRDAFTTEDGSPESPATYGLCYRCHERERVLDSPDFPEHRRHVVDLRASCSTCHNPHGSYANRSLIRFDQTASLVRVSSSTSTGRLAFESEIPGNGACYLTCHGFDHGPATYGAVPNPQNQLTTPQYASPRRPHDRTNVGRTKRRTR